MPASPAECRYREPLAAAPQEARCRLVAQVLGDDSASLCRVPWAACQACCRTLPTGDALNPVVASLVHQAAARVVRQGGTAACTVARAERIRDWVLNHVAFVPAEIADRCFPPVAAAAAPRTAGAAAGNGFQWAVGLLTAPRQIPTIERTLAGLESAGYRSVHVFAEPGSWLPDTGPAVSTVVRTRRLGNLVNFYSALETLYRHLPEADGFAIFQDDVLAAEGLRAWCEEQFWPLGAGIVSLFTPWIHSDRQIGWRLHAAGYHRVFGAQALVFRRDLLERFLADVHVLRELQTRRSNDDAVVSGWATRQRLGVAYHTPSLVQHIGHVSSIYEAGPDRRIVADAVAAVGSIPSWIATDRRPGRIGLVGWHTASGLGYQNEDLARQLEVDRWLVPVHPQYPTLSPCGLPCRMEYVPPHWTRQQLRRWVRGLDWVLFVERSYLPELALAARWEQVSIACVPNWEWMQPRMEWLNFVDLMICPTRLTYAHCQDWNRRYGFGWQVIQLPWPIDAERFDFRLRERAERFVFVNGWGGGRACYVDGTPVAYLRKGVELMAKVARLCPQLPLTIYSQQAELPAFPPHVDLRPPPRDPRQLYRDGQICVQPSHWEGLGMQLLECQAAGMPLVTTDAAPMNEHNPLRTIPVDRSEVVTLGRQFEISSHCMRAEQLAEILRQLAGTDIAEASRRARAFVLVQHGWQRARQVLQSRLVAH